VSTEWPEYRRMREERPDLFPATVWPLGVWALSVVAASLSYQDGQWLQPLNFVGEPCPFPMDPLLMPKGAPLGQYHCPYCGDMVVAGLPHGDWRNVNDAELPPPAEANEIGDWAF
jgi:hypothetical protein